MKIAHLSDLHIGKKVNGFDLIEDQRDILSEILDVIKKHKVETVLMAGDIYDVTMPSAVAVSLFDDFLTQLRKENINILITSGNHDSVERLSFASEILSQSNIYISNRYEGILEKVVIEDDYGLVNFYLLPYIKPIMVREYFPDKEIQNYDQAIQAILEDIDLDKDERNIILSHQFIYGGEISDSEELSIGGLDQVSHTHYVDFDYVALGHLHGPQKVGQDHIRYAGSPLKYSFSEKNHKKSVPIIDIKEKGNTKIDLIPIYPLRDMKEIRGKFEDIIEGNLLLEEDKEDYLNIILTDEDEIIDAIGKLRSLYPNIMQLSYDNKRTSRIDNVRVKKDNMKKNPLDLFKDFYKDRNNIELDKNREDLMIDIIEKVWR